MDDIAGMLTQYEEDYHTGMDIEKISSLIYDYTSGYLDHYHLKKGYMLSFCFNKNKNIGVYQITLGDKVLVEAIV